MKKLRLLAWTLILAMLAAACPALGEALEVELPGGGTVEALSGDALELEDGPLDLDMGADLSAGLTEAELSLDLADVPGTGEAANGDPSGELAGRYQSQGGYDNDALFAGYVDMLFGKSDSLGLRPNGWAGDRLTGPVADTYDYLAKQIQKVASGALTDTGMTVPSSVLPTSADAWTAVNAIDDILEALLLDFPYHMFWYDKTRGVWYGIQDGVLTINFIVAEEYAAGTYATDAAKIKSVHVAAARAKNVVKKYAGASDYEKLCGYRDYICDAVSYNYDAAASPSMPYGNPWQLIWAFDGNPATNIVCEGYAKAFQYLCDMSAFNGDIQCHILEGYVQDYGSNGPHMWNLVAMEDGRSYHTDITFVDTGMSEAFLCGAVMTEYKNTYMVDNSVFYQLEEGCAGLYTASLRKLSSGDYTPGRTVAAKRVKLKKSGATLKKGQKLSLKRGKSLTLKAVVSPANAQTTLTWKSSRSDVTVKDGKVTVSKKAKAGKKAKITVATANGKSAYIYIVIR